MRNKYPIFAACGDDQDPNEYTASIAKSVAALILNGDFLHFGKDTNVSDGPITFGWLITQLYEGPHQ